MIEVGSGGIYCIWRTRNSHTDEFSGQGHDHQLKWCGGPNHIEQQSLAPLCVEKMAKGRAGVSNSHRQTSIVRGRRALNAFRIDKNHSIEGAAAEEEMLVEEGDADGQVKSEDDEDIDSDEAFDESDEERFSTFKFSGSLAKGRQANNLPRNSGNFQQKARFESQGSVDDEEETKEEDEADDETHMDLSEMLAQGQSSHKSVKKPPR
jgi:hypothetical protein